MKTRLLFIAAFLLLAGLIYAQENKASVQLTEAIYEEEVTGNLDKAVELYLDILKKFPDDRPVAAKTLYHLGLVNEKMGMQKAREYFTRLVNAYPDQTEVVALAKAKLAALNKSVVTPVTKITEGPVTRQILKDASNVSGSLSLTADGKYVIGLNWENGNVSRFETASGQISNIENKGQWTGQDMNFMSTALSRDGKFIAFDSYTEDWIPQLLVRNLDGSEVRQLYCEKDYYVRPLDWSPEGETIVALRSNNFTDQETNELTLISTRDGSLLSLRSIPSTSFMVYNARFSPDGQYIAFSYVRDGNPPHEDIFLMTSEGLNEVVVASNPSEDKLIGWTPGGENLIFLSDRSGTWDIWSVSIKEGKQQGEPELLKKNFGYDSEVLGIGPAGAFYYKVTTPSGGLYSGTIDIETSKIISAPSPVSKRYTGPPYSMSWSDDGNYLLYLSRRGVIGPGNNLITIRSDDTGEERFLKPYLRFVNQLHWVPDGRSIFAIGITYKDRGVFRIDAETGTTTQLPVENGYAPRLCPDGKTLVFVKGGAMTINKLNLDTGIESEIAETVTLNYDLSPDGKKVVYQKDSTVKTISINGGEPEELIRGLAEYYSLQWTRDGRYIIAQALPSSVSSGEISRIWCIPAEGGTLLKLDISVANLLSFSLHPDNRRFVMSVTGDPKSELWVLENFLPEETSETDDQLVLRKLDYAQLNSPYAEISPDGNKIAYYIAGKPDPGIGILHIGSGTAKMLVEKGGGGLISKAWSPMSDKIVYRLNSNELHICDLEGGKNQLLYKSPEYNLYPNDWSNDGEKILCFFEAEDMTLRIGTISMDGKISILASGNQSDFSSKAKFSTDGKYIAFSRKDEKGNSDIFTLASDGSGEERVTSHPGGDQNPVWSPDGKYLLFMSDRNRSDDLWAIQMKNGKPTGAPFIIKRNLGWRTMIQDITENGKLFLFMLGGPEPANLFEVPVNQATGNLSRHVDPISIYLTDHSFPRYSPDGKLIAYLSRRGEVGYPKLFVMDKKGSERELTLKGHYVVNIAWNPDNQSLFFAGWDKTLLPGIYEISLETGEIESVLISDDYDFKINKGMFVNINLLPETGELMFFKFLGDNNVEVLTLKPDEQQPEVILPEVKMPIWGLPSPDGENICYRLGDSLMVVSVANGEIKHIGSSTRNLEATWSPGGESLVFREGTSMKIFSPIDGSIHTLYQAPEGKTIGGMEMYASSWSPNGNYFVFTESDNSESSASPQKIILINPIDGSFKVIGEAPEGYRLSELRWSPDGSRIIATGNNIIKNDAPRYEYWMLENFLPK